MDKTSTQATQPELEALEDGLSEKDEDPGVQDGVEGIEAEGEEIPHLSAVRGDGLSEASDLRGRGGDRCIVGGPPILTPHLPLLTHRDGDLSSWRGRK